MLLLRKYWLIYRIRHYRKFLLREGVREAARRRKNIQLGSGETLLINEDRLERIFIPQDSMGRIDISPLLLLGAERFPKEARLFVIYERMLERISKHTGK